MSLYAETGRTASAPARSLCLTRPTVGSRAHRVTTANKANGLLDEAYIEAIIEWAGSGPSPVAGDWFTRRGFVVTTMRTGLLISADRGAFDAAFALSLESVEPPVDLPVPDELADVVSSIMIPKPRSFG